MDYNQSVYYCLHRSNNIRSFFIEFIQIHYDQIKKNVISYVYTKEVVCLCIALVAFQIYSKINLSSQRKNFINSKMILLF